MPRKIPRELPPRPPRPAPPEEYGDSGDEEISEEQMEDELAQPQLPRTPQPPQAQAGARFQPRQPPQPRTRYSSFQQQAAEGVIDTETQEVVAADMWTAFANIMERLERIENSIGTMLGS